MTQADFMMQDEKPNTQTQNNPTSNQTLTLLDKLRMVYSQPFPNLLYQAQTIHRENHAPSEIQLCTLSNIKSGNCPEDCAYCPQSARYNTGIDTWDLPSVEQIKAEIADAKANGSTRFCMGAAWRTPPHQKAFDHVLELVKTVTGEGMEACVTMGMLNAEQAVALKEAGLKAYNHNIDTAPSFYPEIITTRTIQDRLDTIKHVADAGIDVCCGGILGMGESVEQRLEFLQTLCELEVPPESVPINCLVPVEGTPLADQAPVDGIELVRTIATTRIFLPGAKVRLSAGRLEMSDELQALCFLAGANAIFTGEKLLTTANPGLNRDELLMQKLGMVAQN
ncbi:MAG: biotin synthase BioB [Vampirovibrionales bacterium]|nr:biotin synthase BioB [Vampirovibrionales bacterium]